MRHYHVLCGLQGCFMPETNDVCDSWQEAIEYAAIQADGWADAHEIPVVKHDNAYYTIGPFSVEIHPCDSTQCEGVDND